MVLRLFCTDHGEETLFIYKYKSPVCLWRSRAGLQQHSCWSDGKHLVDHLVNEGPVYGIWRTCEVWLVKYPGCDLLVHVRHGKTLKHDQLALGMT